MKYLIACLGVVLSLIGCGTERERMEDETRISIRDFTLTHSPDSISPLPLNDTIMPEFHSRRIPMNFMEHSEPLPPFNDLSADED